MEPSPDSVANQKNKVQENPQDLASRVRTQSEQFIAKSHLKLINKDLSKAAPGPEFPNEASDFLPGTITSIADHWISRAGDRELLSLASANAPRMDEDGSIGAARRPRKSYIQ